MKKAVFAMLFAMVLSVVSAAFAQDAAPAADDQAAPAAAATDAAPAAEAEAEEKHACVPCQKVARPVYVPRFYRCK